MEALKGEREEVRWGRLMAGSTILGVAQTDGDDPERVCWTGLDDDYE